jgi:hypothetical protein
MQLRFSASNLVPVENFCYEANLPFKKLGFFLIAEDVFPFLSCRSVSAPQTVHKSQARQNIIKNINKGSTKIIRFSINTK